MSQREQVVPGAGKGKDNSSSFSVGKIPILPTLCFIPKRPISDSDLEFKVMNLCCFRLLKVVVICSSSNRKLAAIW